MNNTFEKKISEIIKRPTFKNNLQKILDVFVICSLEHETEKVGSQELALAMLYNVIYNVLKHDLEKAQFKKHPTLDHEDLLEIHKNHVRKCLTKVIDDVLNLKGK